MLVIGAILAVYSRQNGIYYPRLVLDWVSHSDGLTPEVDSFQRLHPNKHLPGARPGSHKLGPLEDHSVSRVVLERPRPLAAPYQAITPVVIWLDSSILVTDAGSVLALVATISDSGGRIRGPPN